MVFPCHFFRVVAVKEGLFDAVVQHPDVRCAVETRDLFAEAAFKLTVLERDDDIMVGGENFGCGSSREHAPIAIKESGIALVIAKSFARIFYRNSINIGLAIVECPEAVDAISEGDTVEADLDNGIIRDVTTGKEFHVAPFPEFIQTIIANGGLIESIKKGAVK